MIRNLIADGALPAGTRVATLWKGRLVIGRVRTGYRYDRGLLQVQVPPGTPHAMRGPYGPTLELRRDRVVVVGIHNIDAELRVATATTVAFWCSPSVTAAEALAFGRWWSRYGHREQGRMNIGAAHHDPRYRQLYHEEGARTDTEAYADVDRARRTVLHILGG